MNKDILSFQTKALGALYETASILAETTDFSLRLKAAIKNIARVLNLKHLALVAISLPEGKKNKTVQYSIRASYNASNKFLASLFNSISSKIKAALSNNSANSANDAGLKTALNGANTANDAVLKTALNSANSASDFGAMAAISDNSANSANDSGAMAVISGNSANSASDSGATAVISDNSANTPELPTLPFYENERRSEVFCIPLTVEGKASYMLLACRCYTESEAITAQSHYKFLYLISQNIASAIEHEIASENAKRAKIFLEISKDFASTLDPYLILQKAFNQFGQVIDFLTIGVLLFDDLENTYRFIAQPNKPISSSYQAKLSKLVFGTFSEFPSEPPITKENFAPPVFFKPLYEAKRAKAAFKHVLQLPIIIGKKMRGLIHLTRAEDKPFTSRELDITSQFTGIFITSIKNALIHKRTEKLAFTDPLTELFNHRYFQETLKHELIRARRYVKPLSLMILDIDFFKKFNDSYGHLVGDKVLRHVASIFKNSVREKIDTVARYGGEEFAVILPETTIEGAYVFAERIRSSVEKSRLIHEDKTLSVTISIGVACTKNTLCGKTNELIEAADTALYTAKENGRNRVIKYENETIKTA